MLKSGVVGWIVVAAHAQRTGDLVDGFFGDDVDHTGDRIRTILGGGTIAQDLNTVDGRNREGIQIGSGVTATAGSEYRYEGSLVTAFTVDQHQGLIGTQSTQGGQIDVVSPIATGLFVVVERRSQVVQRGGQVQTAGGGDCLSDVDHIYRGHGLGFNTTGTAGTHHHDFAHGFNGRRHFDGEGRRFRRNGLFLESDGAQLQHIIFGSSQTEGTIGSGQGHFARLNSLDGHTRQGHAVGI